MSHTHDPAAHREHTTKGWSSSRRWRWLGASALASIAFVAGCGGDDDSSNAEAGSDSTTTAAAEDTTTTAMGDMAEASGEAADIAFAQGMISHHQQAVEMSEIALDPARGASQGVVDLATRIKSAQDPEINTMRAMLAKWGAPEEMDMSQPHDMSSMEGMASPNDIEKLAKLNGTEFDVQWATLMKAHHEGAVTSATAVVKNGSDPEMRTLAEGMVTAQSSEITELDSIIGG